MTTHPNYYADHFRGQIIYRCCQCPYDSFSLDSVRFHVLQHPPVKMYDRGEVPTLAAKYVADLKGTRIAIGVLTSTPDWPTRSLEKACQNAVMLRALGLDCQVIWVDNGSPIALVDENKKYADWPYVFASNKGQSVARNKLIDWCLRRNVNYLHMVDGDIELIDYSTLTLTHQLHDLYSQGDPVGCIGLYSRNCTKFGDDLSDVCLTELELYQNPGIAWTQYGVFNCAMFKDGIRFDEAECFQGQGWGFEDDDLYCQMMNKSWISLNTKYYRYAHALNTSLRAMDPTLAAKVFNKRKEYVYKKWSNNPGVIYDHVDKMRNQSMPVI